MGGIFRIGGQGRAIDGMGSYENGIDMFGVSRLAVLLISSV